MYTFMIEQEESFCQEPFIRWKGMLSVVWEMRRAAESGRIREDRCPSGLSGRILLGPSCWGTSRGCWRGKPGEPTSLQPECLAFVFTQWDYLFL